MLTPEGLLPPKLILECNSNCNNIKGYSLSVWLDQKAWSLTMHYFHDSGGSSILEDNIHLILPL